MSRFLALVLAATRRRLPSLVTGTAEVITAVTAGTAEAGTEATEAAAGGVGRASGSACWASAPRWLLRPTPTRHRQSTIRRQPITRRPTPIRRLGIRRPGMGIRRDITLRTSARNPARDWASAPDAAVRAGPSRSKRAIDRWRAALGEAAERKQIYSRIPRGEYRPVQAADIWKHVADNLSRPTSKASGLEFLRSATQIHRGGIAALPKTLEPAERREQARGVDDPAPSDGADQGRVCAGRPTHDGNATPWTAARAEPHRRGRQPR